MNEEELKKLREEGRKGNLWHIHAIVEVIDVKQLGDLAHWERANLTWEKLHDIRVQIFETGILVHLGKHSYVLIPPRDIRTIYVDRQTKFFEK